jgi:Zn-dependent peptidase ImmA (M78 family)
MKAMAINPKILAWARETAGLSLEDAAHSLGFKDTRDRTAAERIAAMEAGQEEPSRSVLINMARIYHRSLLVFYLSEPPRTGDRGQDFRRAPGREAPEYDPTLDALIRDIRGRQGVVKDLLEQAETGRVGYVGSVKMDTEPTVLARRMTERIGFSLPEFRQRPTVPAAFTYLREKVEASGAFVLLLGNLGSYHTNIPSKVFRGYAIADPIAPFIVVNDQDATVAWAFTVLHELTHVWLGTTGVSGGSPDTRIENYCNNVAGEVLLPTSEMDELRFLGRASVEETIQVLAQFARVRNISRPMVAYKLLRAGLITPDKWRALVKYYDDEWITAHAQSASKERSDGGPSYYVVKRHRLGRALVELVGNSLAEGFLSHTKAGRVLGVNPRNVDPLIHMAGMRGSQ